ncbi:IncFII RepA protein family protein (plasmid) [Sodalis glossinidius str. 'morsitans']|uniref:IncFII RepA protein family protein n=1 Tax=Sodalis glossinidius (strain morsitans) TaxID=343509 RepID=A0A193QNM3_SODGM|nr:plasmid replication initiator RepA [Sodalis glossinidius]CRL46824.1 IncFII RepA protein family protein [Sodalis glossinidius str. 'morsitans']
MTELFTPASQPTLNSPVRDCYVSNPYPCYRSPTPEAAKPAIVKALVKAAQNSNPARHEAWYTTPRLDVKTGLKKPFIKRMNAHRARAVNALMVAMADRLNIVSGKVEASVEQLSDWCGLSTGNGAKKSISRASRALTTLEELGAIKCERVWDDSTHSYIPKIIWVTELFFVLIDYEVGKFLSAQNQQLAWENKKLREKGEGPITLSEARRRAKEKHIKNAFDYRLKKRAFNKQRRHARKIDEMAPSQARHFIINDLVKLHSKDELEAMGHQGLRRLVDQRYHALRKLAASTAPPPDTP